MKGTLQKLLNLRREASSAQKSFSSTVQYAGRTLRDIAAQQPLLIVFSLSSAASCFQRQAEPKEPGIASCALSSPANDWYYAFSLPEQKERFPPPHYSSETFINGIKSRFKLTTNIYLTRSRFILHSSRFESFPWNSRIPTILSSTWSSA